MLFIWFNIGAFWVWIHECIRWHCGKESSCQCRRCKRRGFNPGLGRSAGIGNGTPLQYSSLENPTDRGNLRATVHGVTKSWTRMSMHMRMLYSSSFCIISQTSLPHTSKVQTYKPASISGLFYMNNELPISGINLLECQLCLANCPTFMLQNLTEILLIHFWKGNSWPYL